MIISPNKCVGDVDFVAYQVEAQIRLGNNGTIFKRLFVFILLSSLIYAPNIAGHITHTLGVDLN